ncbi:MAG: MMPL family transporter, partial [Candidatus Theseobacter exili]|nr:MMPL family transporter [Candidatus Theseobacter exili]
AISIYGITKINVNDNPVKWFTPKHEIRVADKILNKHFGGTYTAYLTLSVNKPDALGCKGKTEIIRDKFEKRFGKIFPEETKEFIEYLNNTEKLYRNVRSSNAKMCFFKLANDAKKIDEKLTDSWNNLADEINYLDPEKVNYESLKNIAINSNVNLGSREKALFISRLGKYIDLKGEKLQEKALAICDEFTSFSFREYLFEVETELTAPLFKQPEVLEYVESLQNYLEKNNVVGKTSSAVDALKKASFELSYINIPLNAPDAEKNKNNLKNNANFSIPETSAAVCQVFTQLEGMKKKDSLFHLVTKDYQQLNIWIQLKSGDNKDMEKVVADVESFIIKNPPPVKLDFGWAGLTYLNVIWQDKMVLGMLSSLASSFVVVLVMMMVLFRSPLYGVLSMIPLTVTISFIYGLIGLVGKDYDMPVAILSALTLGLSIDFAIHFLQRAREEQNRLGSWKAASLEMFKEPATAISRNAIIISVGFTPLLFAPLVPYKTVGFFIATIMIVSWLATLFILPALINLFKKYAFKKIGD